MARGHAGCDSGAMPSRVSPVKVFLSEDSLPIRRRIAETLEAAEMEIVGQAETPWDSIAGIEASHPDVVVLDVALQGGPGLDVLRAIHARSPDIGFVVFSNNTELAYRRRYLSAGALEFLDKSNDFDQLVQAVSHACHR